jgi:eukaryotic-like serine/threonine-protein kinase
MREVFHAGQILAGRYRLVRPLGEGGMGAVWAAEQLALLREVAVKVLLDASAEQRPALRAEALALAAVRHPAIVQIHDYDETEGGVPFLVMELVDGESLAARLAREGALSAESAVELTLPILQGLAAAHARGVIHRDVKPENVLLAREPTGIMPKLLDFGIAKRGGSGPTSDRGLIGTPAYMAPEQARSMPTDERTDVWGAAVLLYELIAGARPFGSGDMFAVMSRVVSEPPSYPRDARGLDGRLWSILMAAMRKNARDRTPSALALHDALSSWLRGRGRTAAPAPPPRAAASPLAPTLAAPVAPVAPVAEAPAPPSDEAPSIDALIREKLGDG